MIILAGCQNVKGEINNSIDDFNMNDQQSINISEENGVFYFNGITLGDSKSKVIEILGENYIEDYDDVINAHVILEYENLFVFLNKELLVSKIKIPSFEEHYYEDIFDSYINGGFVYQNGEDKYDLNSGRYFYSKDTSQLVVAKYDPDRNLFVFLTYADANFIEAYEEGAYEHVTK